MSDNKLITRPADYLRLDRGAGSDELSRSVSEWIEHNPRHFSSAPSDAVRDALKSTIRAYKPSEHVTHGEIRKYLASKEAFTAIGLRIALR